MTTTGTTPPRHRLGDAEITVLVPAAATGETHALLRTVVPPAASGPPLHVHPGFGETFYVVDGALDLHVAGELRRLRAGEAAHVPGDVPHTYSVPPGAGGATFLIMCAPGGLDSFIAEAAALAGEGSVPDPETMARLRRTYGMELAEAPEGGG